MRSTPRSREPSAGFLSGALVGCVRSCHGLKRDWRQSDGIAHLANLRPAAILALATQLARPAMLGKQLDLLPAPDEPKLLSPVRRRLLDAAGDIMVSEPEELVFQHSL